MPRKTDKRVRLIDAAKVLIHQQGFNLTTLADIAQEADVPLGNVYYYFKTNNQGFVSSLDSRLFPIEGLDKSNDAVVNENRCDEHLIRCVRDTTV